MARVKKVAKSAKAVKSSSKHKDEVIKLKKQLREANALWKSKIETATEEAYSKGYSTALADQIKLDEAFDKFMENAASQFEKKYLKKLKSSKGKSPKAKKAKGKRKAKKA